MKKSTARVAAIEAGEKFYTPESPCHKGHTQRYTSTGRCCTCRLEAEKKRVAADRLAYNARKKRERTPKLAQLAAKARAARAAETPEQRTTRLEKAKLKQRIWRANNPTHAGVKTAKAMYKQRNPHKVRADTVKRRTEKLRRTPAWLTPDDFWMIEQAYDIATARTKIFGFSWHVDHVLPLQGRLVSGLHTPYNLQVIPGVVNVAKANRYLPA